MPKSKKKKKTTKSKKAKKVAKPKKSTSKTSKKKEKILPVSQLDIYDEFAKGKVTDTIETVAKTMASEGVENVILVNDKDEPLACVSAVDIVKGIAEGIAISAECSEIMSNCPVVDESESISEVFEMMDEYDSEFVAVTKKGKLVGCCTLKDLMIDDWIQKDRSYDLVVNEEDGTFDLKVIWE